MKTFKLTTAIVLVVMVVGLIGVFSAFSAEQTNQGKKEGVLTDTQESKDKKKGPSTTIQAPAANLQSLPLTITRLYLKDGTVRVVIKKKKGSDRLSDEDYATTKLKVETKKLKKPLEWTLQEVDPRKYLNHLKKEKDFDTGLAVTERTKVTATLYRALWKTAKEGTLSPMMAKVDAKTHMGTPEKKDTSRDLMLGERETPPGTAASGVIKETVQAPGKGSKGTAKGPSWNHGIVVEQPLWGAVYVLGARMPVVIRLEEGIPGGEWNDVRIILRGVNVSFEQELHSGLVHSGDVVEVELPEDCPEGFERNYRIKVERSDDVYGYSGSFTLLSPTGGMTAYADAWDSDNDAAPTSINVFEPSALQPPWRLRTDTDPNLYWIRWYVYPLFMAVHERFMIYCVTEDGDSPGDSIMIRGAIFDNESRMYSTRVDIRDFDLDPGRYRVLVRLLPTAGDDFPAVSDLSDVITLEPAIPAQTLERAFEEGCVQVMEPEGNISIHAGTDLRVRWEFCPELEELIESERGALELPLLEQYVRLYRSVPGGRFLEWETKVPGHTRADTRSYDIPLSRELTPGIYHVEVEARMYLYGTGPETTRGRSDDFTIVCP